jgi:hypothetical protein
LVSLVLGFGFGRMLRLIFQNSLATAAFVRLTAQIGGYAINYLVGLFVLYYILNKPFRHFRLGLVSSLSGAPTIPVDVTYTRPCGCRGFTFGEQLSIQLLPGSS